MTVQFAFTDLSTALDADAWEWLQEARPRVAQALQSEVTRGATAETVRRFAARYGVQQELAARLQQAAAHLERERAQEAVMAASANKREVRNAR